MYSHGSYGKKHKVYHDVSDDWPYYPPPLPPTKSPMSVIHFRRTPFALPAPMLLPVLVPAPVIILPTTPICTIPPASQNDPNLTDYIVVCSNFGFTQPNWSWL